MSNNATNDIANLNLQVPDITSHFEDVITVALMTPLGDPFDEPNCIMGLPASIWGLSGIGKSDRIRGVSQALDLPYNTLLPGQRAPEDFSGAYMPNGQGGVLPICTLPGLNDLLKAGKGTLFIDEASCATPAVQGAMLGLVNDRRAGDVVFPPGLRILLAANPPEYSAGGWALEPPMANRLAHFQLNAPPAHAWADWLLYRKLVERPALGTLQSRLLSGWPSASGRMKGLAAGFMQNRGKSLLHMQPLAGLPQGGYNWPSPRTWYFAVQAAATCRALGFSSDIEQLIIEGCIGAPATNEFLAWVKDADLPSPEEVIVKNWKPDVDRLDVTMAVVSSVTSYVIDMPKEATGERYDAAAGVWRFLQSVIEAQLPDLVVSSACLLSRNALSRTSNHQALKKACEPVLMLLNKRNMLKYIPDEIRI